MSVIKTIRMERRYSILIILMAIFLATSCHKKTKEDKIPVAKVLDKYLYFSDIQHIFPSKITKEDSISLAKSYISTWIKTQLILNKAELNLSADQLDITQQIEAYRSSLLIYKYEELMLKDKLDTVVSDAEIEAYFNQNASNFILEENLIKVLFIKIPKKAPNIDKLKIWYKSDQREDIKKLDSYCYNYAAKYDYFKDNWVLFSFIQNELPNKIENEDEYLKANKYIEQEDNDFFYFVYIKERNSKGAISPINFVHNKIKDIIINKRKVKFLTDLETKIYNDAQDHDHFVIYNYEKK
jgi:hypothetical protein